MKVYQVVFVDEYNNWFLCGFYKSLLDAEKDVNEYLSSYTLSEDVYEGQTEAAFGEDKPLGHLEEYASTFESNFDRVIDVECGCVEVRGFIFDKEALIECLN